jgi:ATP-dependent Clp protease adaptor protein ClpS
MAMTTTHTAEPLMQQVPQKDVQTHSRSRKQPLYHVVLLDDDDHTYDYVIGMLRKLFGMPTEQAFRYASDVDSNKRVILDTTTLERAELKRDQIHSFGRDWRIPRCSGSMTSLIEPAPE